MIKFLIREIELALDYEDSIARHNKRKENESAIGDIVCCMVVAVIMWFMA